MCDSEERRADQERGAKWARQGRQYRLEDGSGRGKMEDSPASKRAAEKGTDLQPKEGDRETCKVMPKVVL